MNRKDIDIFFLCCQDFPRQWQGRRPDKFKMALASGRNLPANV